MAHKIETVSSTREYLDRLWEKAPEDVVKLRGSMAYGDELKYISATFSEKEFPNGIELLMLTDLQLGSLQCDVNKFIEYRDWILSKPNRFVFFGGDMVDAATILSVASPYENTMDPQNQVYRFAELAMPMRHRVLGYTGGNHERRSSKTFGDIGHMIATLLKVPYSAGRQFIDINYGLHKPFKVDLFHGASSGGTKGAQAQALHRFMCQGEAHLYLIGHMHSCALLYDWRQRRKNKKIILEKFVGVLSSSFLTYWGSYAETAGMAPSGTIMARCILTPDGKSEITLR